MAMDWYKAAKSLLANPQIQTNSHQFARAQILTPKKNNHFVIRPLTSLHSGWWYTYPSEKYARQLG